MDSKAMDVGPSEQNSLSLVHKIVSVCVRTCVYTHTTLYAQTFLVSPGDIFICACCSLCMIG